MHRVYIASDISTASVEKRRVDKIASDMPEAVISSMAYVHTGLASRRPLTSSDESTLAQKIRNNGLLTSAVNNDSATLIDDKYSEYYHSKSVQDHLKSRLLLELENVSEALVAIKVEISAREFALNEAKKNQSDLEAIQLVYQNTLLQHEQQVFINAKKLANSVLKHDQAVKISDEFFFDENYISSFKTRLCEFVEAADDKLSLDLEPMEASQRAVLAQICLKLGLMVKRVDDKDTGFLRIWKTGSSFSQIMLSPRRKSHFEEFKGIKLADNGEKSFMFNKEKRKNGKSKLCNYCKFDSDSGFKLSVTSRIESIFKPGTLSKHINFRNTCEEHRTAITHIGQKLFSLHAFYIDFGQSGSSLKLEKTKKSDGAFIKYQAAFANSNQAEDEKTVAQDEIEVVDWKKAKKGYIKPGTVLWKDVKPLDAENVGYQLLMKGGWEPGKGLGADETTVYNYEPIAYPGCNRFGLGHKIKKKGTKDEKRTAEISKGMEGALDAQKDVEKDGKMTEKKDGKEGKNEMKTSSDISISA